LAPDEAWRNVSSLLRLPRTRIIGEAEGFAHDYEEVSKSVFARGNLVPDAHIATILREHGVLKIYTGDADFRKFGFLEVINPLL
jgi:predicted nucleic acid-binding protein